MAGVVCCVFSLPSKPERIKLNELPLSETVDNLKAEIARHVAIPASELTVIFSGRCLNGLDTLESCGVKPGMTVHLLRKPEHLESLQSPEKIDSSEIGLQRLVMALKIAIRNPAYRSTVQRLSKPDVLEDIIAATPGLAEDPIAIAILQDPDLLMQFTDVATIHRVVETHPALAEAINYIVAAVHGETNNLAGPANGSLPAAYSYLLDALSDDEDLDSSQADQAGSSGTSQTPNQADSSHSLFPAITPAQLASALAAVATASPIAASTPVSIDNFAGASSQGASSSADLPNSIISPELFNLAMQQALGASTQNQLQQLRDMGITDDSISMRALQFTGGDVQAALDLIFGDGVELGDRSSPAS